MKKANFDNYAKQFPQHIAFWNTLKLGFDYFEKNKMMAKVTQVGGQYVVR